MAKFLLVIIFNSFLLSKFCSSKLKKIFDRKKCYLKILAKRNFGKKNFDNLWKKFDKNKYLTKKYKKKIYLKVEKFIKLSTIKVAQVA